MIVFPTFNGSPAFRFFSTVSTILDFLSGGWHRRLAGLLVAREPGVRRGTVQSSKTHLHGNLGQDGIHSLRQPFAQEG